MGDLITATREFLLEFLEANQYLALAIYVGVEEAGVPFPVPADTAIVLMGFQVYRGVANPVAVVATVVGSATAGASVLYWLARLIGPRLLTRFGRALHITPERRERAERWIHRYEVPAVVIGRLIPGFRIVITIVAGRGACQLLEVPAVRRPVSADLGGYLHGHWMGAGRSIRARGVGGRSRSARRVRDRPGRGRSGRRPGCVQAASAPVPAVAAA